MLRKRTRSHQRAQMMSGSDSNSQSEFSENTNQKTNSFFSIPGIFVGLSNKGLSDYDSVWSPTSPLDFRVFSNMVNPFAISPRPSNSKNPKGERSSKVGLSIVDSLDNDAKSTGEVMDSSECKNILFGAGMRIKNKNPRYDPPVEPFSEFRSLPKDYPVFPQTLFKIPPEKQNTSIVFEIGDDALDPHQLSSRSLDSCSPFSSHSGLAAGKTNFSAGNVCVTTPGALSFKSIGQDRKMSNCSIKPSLQSLGSSTGFLESVSESEIELSEDYTCIISHGPNPKTTRIYNGRVIDSPDINFFSSLNNPEEKPLAKTAAGYPLDNFLSLCHFCNQKLDEDKDVYIYRGEKAFCSPECRSMEIMNEEEEEKTESLKKSSRLAHNQEISDNCVIFTA